MRRFLAAAAALAALALASPAAADPPELAAWIRNTHGETGYGGITADVQVVSYSDSFVYVASSGIPWYTIGPWANNPNTPANQNWRFKIARHAVPAVSHTATPLGTIGAWITGVSMFNPRDAMSYQNKNIWHQNACVVEAPSFDGCYGHPAPGGVYHHHENPHCLYSISDSTIHSPILGYSFDGYPVYGPYGFANADGTGGVRRIRTSYRTRNITQRTTLPNGTVLAPTNYGPAVSATFPLEYYVEDFEYVGGLGDLDVYNGRFVVTPEYPQGTYAYISTIDASGAAEYPYMIGPSYYGVLVAGNTGPGGGHVTISEPVTVYSPAAGVPPGSPNTWPLFRLARAVPNPARGTTRVTLSLGHEGEVAMRVVDITGRAVRKLGTRHFAAGEHALTIDMAGAAPGVYFVVARSGYAQQKARFTLLR